ncbi:DUF805 domain-containing protein [Phenylobacterium sp.]|uniref:DUF805 domain-containing protein n=1 Tax=Phenylobacterium sp. TaxID=1871053 RepID=UPI0035B1B0FC
MVEFLFSGQGRVRRRDYALGGLFLIVSPAVFAVLGLIAIHLISAPVSRLAPGVQEGLHQIVLEGLHRANVEADRTVVGWGESLLMFLPLLAIGALAAAWSFFALTAKRLHDAGWSGWLSALVLLPGIGAWMIYLVMIFVPGQIGPNRYGADPRGRDTRLAAARA